MATTTITITSATNPTYGGCIDFDGTSTYVRTVLSGGNPTVNFATPNIKRAFAFFDLSTDPTGGGTITKVELLATVASVSGTHAVDIVGGDCSPLGSPISAILAGTDASIYSNCVSGGDFGTDVSGATYSAGAQAIDLGVFPLSDLPVAISNGVGWFLGICLSNEAAAGSVVFDAAVGFGLRLTYTAASTGFNAMMLTGAGA